ncbi:hypothetical protein BS17DRAFT_780296 [Gyrodon lividus]|nr:hypothetical protein BS17DRAFT_780296 [Gyrodon lividus]
MPPARRTLEALGSLPLLSYANNPSKVITELAFITDERLNALGDGAQSAADAPLEVQFDEFMDGVNSRGKDTKTRQRKTTAEQAAAVLLVAVQHGHIELTVNKDHPDTIETITILPAAKKKLATFLPKLRGYGDIPYDQQYRGAVALAKRHFFPTGRAPTKKELMSLLLQCQQEKKDLRALRPVTRMLNVQTSLADIASTSRAGKARHETKNSLAVQTASFASLGEVISLSASQSSRSNDNDVSAELDQVAPDANIGNDANGDMVPEFGMEPAPVVPRTPAATRTLHPYMTPMSNPRQTDHAAAVPFLFDSSPTAVTNASAEEPFGSSNSSDEGATWMLQETAMFQDILTTVYAKFAAVCQKASNLEAQNIEIQTKLDCTRSPTKLRSSFEKPAQTEADRAGWSTRFGAN